MSEEDNLIEELKRSLKLTENEFLQSEIDDLKEFFTVELTEHSELCKNPNEPKTSDCDKKSFWLQVSLPITLRNITKEGKEVLSNEKPLISFKIKLKNGECFAEEVAQIKEQEDIEPLVEEETNTENTSISVNHCDDSSIDDLKTDETTVNDTSKNACTTCNEAIGSDDSLPYDIEQVTVSALSEESEIPELSKITEIFELLIQENDHSLLDVIEQFYIKLEDQNYPKKEVICRDYYYPVFDCRHWGRSSSANKSQNKSQSLLVDANGNDSSISYRARALYDFQALMQGELSFQENEILIVLANLGNGWLTARRTSSSFNSINDITGDDTITGLIPENYIERLQ